MITAPRTPAAASGRDASKDAVSAAAQPVWRALLPPEVVVVVANASTWAAAATAHELRAVDRAVESRRREYRASRAAARVALEALGVHGFDLVPGTACEPVWPDGIVGSITHKGAHCAVAAARAGDVLALGIDVEEDGPLDSGLVPIVCSDAERCAFARSPALGVATSAKIAFSVKEAFYKAYFPATRTFLEFHDAHVALRPESGMFVVALRSASVPSLFGRRSAPGRFVVRDGWIFSAIAIRRDPEAPRVAFPCAR